MQGSKHAMDLTDRDPPKGTGLAAQCARKLSLLDYLHVPRVVIQGVQGKEQPDPVTLDREPET